MPARSIHNFSFSLPAPTGTSPGPPFKDFDITQPPRSAAKRSDRESPTRTTRSRRTKALEAVQPSEPYEPPEWSLAPAEPGDADFDRPPKRYGVDLDDSRMDAEAAKVVRRLTRHGYEAYLVGGCVRDLLLGKSPKDFDVATSALPDDVRTLFRNSRIIGRRFRLVHVLFSGGKIIETATFRRNPADEDADNDDLLIRSDNVFGRADEDARRRDFTINALFYDPDKKQVLDWCDGIPDVRSRAVRIIGDPVVRFQEDPVRMLRALRFSARLDLGIVPEVYHAIVACRESLAMAARPRLFEELLKLLRSGAARRSYWLAWETGALDVLLPELSTYLTDLEMDADEPWRILAQVDRHCRKRVLDDVVLWTLLLLPPMREACSGEKDRVGAGFDFLEPITERLAVPRRISDAMRRIIAMLPRLEAGKPGRFANSSLYPLAQQVFDIYAAASPHRRVDAAPTVRRRRKARPAGSE